MMWLSLSLELMYVGLLLVSCTLLSVQLCIGAWFPSTQRWGLLLNAFAAVFTVLGGTEALSLCVCERRRCAERSLCSQVCSGWWVT